MKVVIILFMMAIIILVDGSLPDHLTSLTTPHHQHHHQRSPCIMTVSSVDDGYFDTGDARVVFQFGIGTQAMYSQLHNYSLHMVATAAPGSEAFIKRLDWARHYAARRLLDGLDCSWIMMTEGDVIITNLTVRVEDIIQEAVKNYLGKEQEGPSLILNRDAAKNINTGTFFIRNSPLGRQVMDRVSVIRHEHAMDFKLKAWGANGAMMIALRDHFVRESAVILPSTLFNSYEIEWKPGHFIRHFAGEREFVLDFSYLWIDRSHPRSAGHQKDGMTKGQAMEKFVRNYPPRTFPGWSDEVFGLLKNRTRLSLQRKGRFIKLFL